jgi:hypothetical protein
MMPHLFEVMSLDANDLTFVKSSEFALQCVSSRQRSAAELHAKARTQNF